MNAKGRACWRGSLGNLLPNSCRCLDDPPDFNLVFPVAEFSTVAPSPATDDAGYYYWLTTYVSPESGFTTDGMSMMSTSAAESPPVITPHSWFTEHAASLKILIVACFSLLLVVTCLVCVVFCLTRRKQKKRSRVLDRPETEGCEDNEQPYDVTSSPETTNKNEFPLVHIDHENNATVGSQTPNSNDVPGQEPTLPSHAVLRTVKAKIVGNGLSPKKVARPVSRHDSTAPLVEHEAAVFRDRYKDRSYGTNENSSSDRLSAEVDPSWRFSGNSDRLSTLDEAGERTSKEPTKLEILPSRHFPAQSILDSPVGRRYNKRPDSSTPLFDGDSIDSSEI